jgi:hypothetical protein
MNEDRMFMPSRPVAPVTSIPTNHILPIVTRNNIQLAQKPLTKPPSPQIVMMLAGTSTGFQFSFNQVTLPIGATNVITSYRIYRNTLNLFAPQLVHTIPHDPTHLGAVIFTDTITSATGQNFYYWVTSVDTTGQESSPQAAQSGAVAGNLGSTPYSNTGGFTYTATTTSITWAWASVVIYRADGTSTNVPDGSQTVTSLSPSTTYLFYPYWNEAAQAVQWVGQGMGTPAYAHGAPSAVAVQLQNLRNQIALSIGNMPGATPAAGTGGGSGGGGGGGGCVEHGTVVVEPIGSTHTIENNSDWMALTFEGHEPVNMHPDTLVVVYKRVADLKEGDMISAGGDGGWRTDWIVRPFTRPGVKVKRTCPGGRYRAGSVLIELHNFKPF